MRPVDEAQVWLDEEPGGPVQVGTLQALFLTGRHLASSSFEYAPSYLTNAHRYELSPDLPLIAGRQFFGEDSLLPGALSDAAPDDWGASLIDAAFARNRQGGDPVSLGAFDHLVMLGDEARMGALRLRTASGTWLSPEAELENGSDSLGRFAAAAARFSSYEATDDDIELLGAAGSSLGGARPKVNVRLKDGKLWLVKLPSTRDRGIDGEAWEATALQLARRAGIQLPRHRLIRTEGGPSSLMIERFDRADDARKGYMSARTAMELGTQGRATYADFADAVDKFTGSRDDLAELFSRVALTVLTGNADDHWKNHGFVRADHSWRLSPIFDVNPVTRPSRIISRQISPQDDPTNRDIRILIEGSDVYGLSQAQAATVMAQVVAAVEKWRDIAAANGITPNEIEHMSSAFSAEQFDHALRFVERNFPDAAARAPERRA